MARKPSTTAPVAEVAAPVVTEAIAELRARLAAAEAAEAEVAALIESARVASLKEQYTIFNETFESAQSNLEAFEAGLSVADRALLGVKVQADRSPKGATLTTLRAHVASLAPGSRFTTAHLLEAVVPDASAATVRSALGQLGIEPIGKGKGAHYVIAPSEPSIAEPTA
jgi:polyribonucleotide nucleotidyltransferase